jgi:hypothetical protein
VLVSPVASRLDTQPEQVRPLDRQRADDQPAAAAVGSS